MWDYLNNFGGSSTTLNNNTDVMDSNMEDNNTIANCINRDTNSSIIVRIYESVQEPINITKPHIKDVITQQPQIPLNPDQDTTVDDGHGKHSFQVC